jgi:hypothetical protein
MIKQVRIRQDHVRIPPLPQRLKLEFKPLSSSPYYESRLPRLEVQALKFYPLRKWGELGEHHLGYLNKHLITLISLRSHTQVKKSRTKVVSGGVLV